MAWTKSDRAVPPWDLTLSPLLRPLDELLISGGDGRLKLGSSGRENIYGCTPLPRPRLVDFASSTASSISTEAYERASASRGALLTAALNAGLESAYGAAVAAAGTALLSQLRIHGNGTKIIFAPSGTDAQLYALFLASALLAEPITSIVAGSDQTGSGTAYTCSGRHFSQTTSGGSGVDKGGSIVGLGENVTSVEIGFCRPDGSFRSADEMDQALLQAVDDAVSRGRSVLFQAMEASKFGWKAPSDATLDKIAARHAGRVQIIVDACQLRTSRTRLKTMLDKGYCVLVTGSKFFTGPPFSGALLVPANLSERIATLDTGPAGLADYCSAYDWPVAWNGLRRHFPLRPNFGQWLRWEAALQEMELYYAVPKPFRDRLKEDFGHELNARIAQATCLELLSVTGPPQPTIFGLILKNEKGPLPADIVANIYHALRRGESAGDSESHPCLLGQPVALPAQRTSALRISLSARLIRQCWSPDARQAMRNRAVLFENLALAVNRLDHQARQINRSLELV